MREIKFRAWDTKKKLLLPVESMAFTYGGWNNWIALATKQHSTYGLSKPDDEWELMQFTGLHDKNGKEIYEGDIVRVLYDEDFMGKDKDTNCEVRYEKKLAMFVLDDGSGLTPDCFETDAELTVVGNVFENPELAGRTE